MSKREPFRDTFMDGAGGVGTAALFIAVAIFIAGLLFGFGQMTAFWAASRLDTGATYYVDTE